MFLPALAHPVSEYRLPKHQHINSYTNSMMRVCKGAGGTDGHESEDECGGGQAEDEDVDVDVHPNSATRDFGVEAGEHD